MEYTFCIVKVYFKLHEFGQNKQEKMYTKSIQHIQYMKALGGAIGSILFVYILYTKNGNIHFVYILYIFRRIISIEDSHG